MRVRACSVATMVLTVVLFVGTAFSALTTDELLQLKKAGISEEIILFMNEVDYKDVDRVLKLKGAGFKDDTILSIIKNDLKGKPSPEISREQKAKDVSSESSGKAMTSKIKILWYEAFKAGPVLAGSQEIDDARITAVSEGRLRIEWREKGLIGVIFKKPFSSPFYWDINKDDTFGPGKDGYEYMLKSSVDHKGKPETDKSHFWVLYLDAKNEGIIDFIRHSLR